MQLNLPPGSALDALPSPLIILNNLGEIVYFNKAWLWFAGINGLEIPGFGVGYNYLAYCEQTTNDENQALSTAAQGIGRVISGELETFSYQYPCRAGNEHTGFQMRAVPIAYEKYRYAILLYENITGSGTSEQSLRNILENAPIGMAIVSLDGRFIEVNQALGGILGYEKAELLNLTCQQINHPDDINSDYELMQELLQGRRNSYRIEKRFVRKDGQIVWVSLTSSILREAAAAQTYIIKQIQDITEIKKTEIELRKSEQLSRMLLNVSSDGFTFSDSNGRFLEVSPSYCQMLGYTESEILNMPISKLEWVKNAEQIEKHLHKIVVDGFDRFETIHRCKDGSLIDVEVSVTYIPDKKQFFAFTRNITQRIQSEKLRIQQLQQQRDVLVREVHHRIKNHLQGMVGLLSLYSYKSSDEKNLIQDIAAKITSVAVVYGVQGKNSQDHAFLCEITSEICRSLENFGKKQNHINYSINVDHRALLPSEYAVPMALIINELMINAIKHSTDLAVKSVQVNLFIDEKSAILTIQNNSSELSSFPDFEQEIGLGVGLSLVRAMLPKTGVCLSLTQQQDVVRASLSIKSPIISII